ncbi:CocE/NonD family hydrolase [Phenylobacterium soli]|uniref:Hydrolase n=1 Tax=Phenylobacterium soli TaxID=2170551 RepID=A0A328AC69_9CAUL|nr:CocE/NonD family hydrolase [Phenylobacterium soli]RAK51786.1 hydrolase [Phenylobacterium soli]
MSVRSKVLMVAAAAWSLAGAAGAAEFGAYKPAPQYDQEVVSSFYLPMRDGVKIAVAVHRPAVNGHAAEGRMAVVWQAGLAIDKAGVGTPKGINALTRYGYVVVQTARRGNGASFGTRRGYEDMTESFDSYEITEWAAAQPWSDGQVGMFGCSNTGEAVMHAISARPPHLKAAWAGCFAWDRFDGHTRGGIIAQFGTGPTRSIAEDMNTPAVEGDETKAELRKAVEEHQASTNLFDLMKSMPYRDSWSPLVMSRFWSEVSMGGVADQVRRSGVALYIQGGWSDDFRTQGLIALANLPGQARMLIGPWRHCRYGDFDILSEQLRFFDHYLKGETTGIEDDAPLHYFRMEGPHGGSWQATRAWPSPAQNTATRYLRAGRLEARAGNGKGDSLTVDYGVTCPPDPESSISLALAVSCHPTTGAKSFAGPVLTHDQEITGHPLADLWITSTAPEADVFAYLEDVAPDGTVTVITDGRQRASLRKLGDAPWNNLGLPWRRSYGEDAEPLKPGEAARVRFDFLACSYVVKKGHRLQVTVAGSDYRQRGAPRVSPAPTLTVLEDAAHASSVSLPLVGGAG